MRHMIMPATIGIGVAVGGCGQNHAVYMYGAQMLTDAAMSTPDVQGSDTTLASYDSQSADLARKDATDQAIAVDGAADGSNAREANGRIDESPGIDGDRDLGVLIAKYLAPMRDAGDDGKPVVRYGAPNFDGGGMAPMYMAPTQS